MRFITALKVSCIFIFCFFNAAYAKEPIHLSLKEAILLAVRDNPNIQTAQLNYLQQKLNLDIQQWQFKPHYSLQTTASTLRVATQGLPIQVSKGVNPQLGASLLSPIGTQISLASTNNLTSHYNPGLSLQVMQPLLRGFGKAVVEAALYNARDSETMARLNIEGSLRNTITAVINAYLEVISAEHTIIIDQEAVKRGEQSVAQTKAFIKAGHKAGNELITVLASVASAKTQLENDKNNLQQTRYALLTAIGMDPNTEVHFTSLDPLSLLKKYYPIPLDDVKRLVLESDIQYQIDQITLHGPTTRGLLVAENNTRWQLDLAINATAGSNNGSGQNESTNNLFNGSDQSQSAVLTLKIPIDDQLAKQAVVNAKIALKEAELALLQEKWSKQTSAINGWNNVISAKRALVFAEDAKVLQEKTYHLSYQKYLHGLIDSLELQSAQLQLIQAQQILLGARIAYLKALVNLDLLTGNTLKTWDVKVRM